MKDFFVSYNKADRAWAEWIAWQLKEQGKQVVIQAWHFGPGCNFPLEMHKAIKECEKILPVLSPDFLTSEFTSPEWAAYFAQDPTGALRKIMPVRVRDCRPDGLLGQIVYVDLLGATPEADARGKLLGELFGGGPPTTPPGFPPDMAPGGGPGPGPKPPFPGPSSSGAANCIAFSVPHQRNPNFAGREDYLTALGAALAGGPAALTQAIAGLGGVGKTQLALEYCYRQRGAYPLVWWVRCEEPATLASDYAGLAPYLGIAPSQDQTQTVAAVRQRLATLPGWLMVLDNVNQPEDLKPYLPHGGQGHIIITSRHQAWRGVAEPLKVEVWPQGEAVAFLLKRTGSTDEANAEKLANELGCLPLALEQAGAFVEETGCTLAEYLGLLASHRADLLAKGSGLSGYERTVATTWLPAFEAVQKKSPAAAELLNLCAFLAPDDIPLEIIREGKEFLPPALAAAVDNPLAWNDALAALKAYSLVQREGDSLSVHRLVQAVTRDRLGDEEKKEWAGVAVRVVNKAFPFDSDDVRFWPTCARLLAHGLAAAGHAEEAEVEPAATSRLLNQMGLYGRSRAEFAQAKALYERSLASNIKTYGPDHPEVATLRNNLGLVLRDLGDLPAAREQYELALAIFEKILGADHPNVATLRNNLGSVLKDLGDLQAAREQLELSLASDLKTYGPDHPEVATRRNNLGGVLQDLGDLQAAREQFELALASDLKTHGPDHLDVAYRRNNLCVLLYAMDDYAGALAQQEQALAIFESFLPPEHPDIIQSLRNLADCHEALGNPDQAAELRARAEALKAQRQAKGLDS
ncbi:MAG: toll/interleukin-1 receptor domain-containing protein [Desulfarculus sp.]|nr:toll/interleukin-1 receptor domain-containing protein [Desulfarculus sp.]